MNPDDPLREVRSAAGAAGADDDDGPEPGDGPESGDDRDEGASAGPGGEAAPRRRRRRRRRRHEAASGERPAQNGTASTSPPAPPAQAAQPAPRGAPATPPRGPRPDGNREGPREPTTGEAGRHRRGEQARRGRGHGRDAREQSRDTREQARDAREQARDSREQARDAREQARDQHTAQRPTPEPDASADHALASTHDGPTLRFDPRRPSAPSDDLDLEGATTPAIPWGKDDDGPPSDVVLAADLPTEAPGEDLDPVTHPLLELPSAQLGDDVASVVGVRFAPGGRVQWYDAGEADYPYGERVVVDSERGARLAWIAVPPARRALRDRNLRRVIRRASEHDLRGEREGDADRAHVLRLAKDRAAVLRLPLKVFRVELFGQLGRGARLNVYYTSDERLDLRELIRDVSGAAGGARVELRQLGVRDEAKAVGGIGSCGLTLCCTTWLPDFVPVSIKMAKDQGLVLSPTKVSGQCGRLKCCLVYEQAAYAELRKGLPKLGKRVIGARGEGRVVEVDVLRQRVRVSYGAGDTEVVPATEVRPLFPSGNQPAGREIESGERDLPEAELAELTDSGLRDLPELDDADDLDLAASVDGTAPALTTGSDDAIEPPADDPSSET
jgi:cell fate regulator YaaT (PSP1 superfamily)